MLPLNQRKHLFFCFSLYAFFTALAITPRAIAILPIPDESIATTNIIPISVIGR